MSPSAGAYLQMAVSFNYRCLALFTDTGYIWMGLATLKVSSPSRCWGLGAACPCSALPPCLSQPDLRRPGGGIPAASLWAPMGSALQAGLAAADSVCTPVIEISSHLCFFI